MQLLLGLSGCRAKQVVGNLPAEDVHERPQFGRQFRTVRPLVKSLSCRLSDLLDRGHKLGLVAVGLLKDVRTVQVSGYLLRNFQNFVIRNGLIVLLLTELEAFDSEGVFTF